MNTEKKASMKNEKIAPQVEEIADLAVTDEQAEQAKGGPQPVLMVIASNRDFYYKEY